MRFSSFRLTAMVAILTGGGLVLPASAAEPSASVSSTNDVARAVPAPLTLDEDGLRGLLTASLQRDYVRDLGELELTLGRPWTALVISNAPVTLKVTEVPTMGVTENFIVRFDLMANGQRLGSWQMPVSARIWRDVWVAQSALHRGELFAASDCLRERRDVLTCRQAYLGDADRTTREISENISAGAVILERHVRPRTVVRRGQVAEAVVRDGAMEISLKVEVLEDGALGQQVRVRNPQSNREFRGKVENEGTISVSL
ncbi:MAG TPA: flagellar basal body P-ring formation chaperone FlgA [Verrucomicrobiae bacterium]|nr:flagellar basal body P-ring formation chaperone FlgA [Verrucomicrobiae bacterium]